MDFSWILQVFSEYSRHWSPPTVQSSAARGATRRRVARPAVLSASQGPSLSEVASQVAALVRRMLDADISADQVNVAISFPRVNILQTPAPISRVFS